MYRFCVALARFPGWAAKGVKNCGDADAAASIKKNSKGEVLLTALSKGFGRTVEKGGKKKAIIFTESRRTQEYLRQILEGTEYAGKIVLFNGSNNDEKSRQIYHDWLNFDKQVIYLDENSSNSVKTAVLH